MTEGAMGFTRPLLVASLICTLMAGEVVTFTSRATQPVELQVDKVVQENTVFFNWSQIPEPLDDPVYETRYKTNLQACIIDGRYTDWIASTNKNQTIPTLPYSIVTLEVRIANTLVATSVHIPSKVPTTRVDHIEATSRSVQATMENACHKYNGRDMYVQFVLKETTKESSIDIRRNIIIKGHRAKLKLKTLKLLPFTDYTVTAIPGNSEGEATNYSLFRETTFKTAPGKPGKVRNLKVLNASPDSLKVRWSAPYDDPPTGVLEKYVVRYRDAAITAEGKKEYVNESTTSLVIRGLQPATAYHITVEAKNKYVSTYSDAAQVIGNTSEERAPPLVIDLKSTAGNDSTTLLLNWAPISTDTADFYMVSLHDGETIIREINTTNITVKFDDLTAGKKYVARVRACNMGGICSNNTEVVAWTRPDPPKVTETQQSLASTASTITMKRPALQNPPGMHWVLLKRYDKERSSCREQTENIKKEAEDVVRQARMANLTEARSSLNRASGYDTELHIVRTIEAEEDWDGSDMYVTLGGDGNPLKSSSDYVAVVVLQKKAGDYSKYHTCEPVTFKTQSYKEEVKALRVIGGRIYVLPL